MISILTLLALAALIYFSCEFFVNGVEWLAYRLKIGETAAGSLLAAFGTALPESAVTLVAVASGAAAQKQIGVGAALGGPLVLATLSYATVGFMLCCCAAGLGRCNNTLQLDYRRLTQDQSWFLVIFAGKILLGLLAFAGKPWLALLFLAAYGLYIRKEMQHEDAVGEVIEPLKLQPKRVTPSLGMVLLQTCGALLVIGFASHQFVIALEQVGPYLGIPPQLVALLFSPIATELPETMNAIIWLRQGKERLALANISGAMMIQATIPSALGIWFTPWLFDRGLLLAGITTMAAMIVLLLQFRRGAVTGRRLALVGIFYPVFLTALILLS